MTVPVVDEVHVVAVLEGVVAAVGTMAVVVRGCDRMDLVDGALVVVVAVCGVCVTVVEVVDVTVVLHDRVPAIRCMGVGVVVVDGAGVTHRGRLPSEVMEGSGRRIGCRV
jgi:hypothetical protein